MSEKVRSPRRRLWRRVGTSLTGVCLTALTWGVAWAQICGTGTCGHPIQPCQSCSGTDVDQYCIGDCCCVPGAPTCGGGNQDSNQDYYTMQKTGSTECLGVYQYSEYTQCNCDNT
jgi:hypothetical protein